MSEGMKTAVVGGKQANQIISIEATGDGCVVITQSDCHQESFIMFEMDALDAVIAELQTIKAGIAA